MAQQSGQEGSEKNTYYILWLLLLIAMVCAMLWYVFQVQLKIAFIYVRIAELAVIHGFFGLIPLDFPYIGDMCAKIYSLVGDDLELARSLTPASIGMDAAATLSETAGTYLRYPVAIFLGFLSIMIYKINVHTRLTKQFNMITLAKQEVVNWPQIGVATKNDILNADLDVGPWAMAMSPLQFAKRNKLSIVQKSAASNSPFAKGQGPAYILLLDKIRAERAFSVQLGRNWHGVEAMPVYRRAIFAVFIARGCRDSKAAAALVARLAASGAEGKLDCTGVDELIQKHMKDKKVQEICRQHAYEFTVFVSLLLFAREDGVVASADFLWVKPLDRRLWYVINNVGRQTPAVEVAGIFSHWNYESVLKRPLSSPKVEEAVTALAKALSEVLYMPDDAEKEEIAKRAAENPSEETASTTETVVPAAEAPKENAAS